MGLFSKSLKSLADYKFPEVVVDRTKKELDKSDITLVEIALLDFFSAIKAGYDLEMVNKDVDVLWHNFILDTQNYADFCDQYIGKFIHHTPYLTEATVSSDKMADQKKYIETSVKRDAKYSSVRSTRLSRYSDDDISQYLLWAVILTDDSSACGSIPTDTVESTYEVPETVSSCSSETTRPSYVSGCGVSSCSSSSSSSSSSSCSSSSSSCSSSSSSSSSCGSSCGGS